MRKTTCVVWLVSPKWIIPYIKWNICDFSLKSISLIHIYVLLELKAIFSFLCFTWFREHTQIWNCSVWMWINFYSCMFSNMFKANCIFGVNPRVKASHCSPWCSRQTPGRSSSIWAWTAKICKRIYRPIIYWKSGALWSRTLQWRWSWIQMTDTLIEIKHPVQSADTFFLVVLGRRGSRSLLTFS